MAHYAHVSLHYTNVHFISIRLTPTLFAVSQMLSHSSEVKPRNFHPCVWGLEIGKQKQRKSVSQKTQSA